MKSSILYIICAIISLLLYIYAPYRIDGIFQMVCLILFAVQSFTVLKEDISRDGLMSFNVLFLSSFFLVTYAFPLFMMSDVLISREGVEGFIDFKVSCKCSALCTLAISIYFWAYKQHRRKTPDFSSFFKDSRINTTIIYLLYYIFSIGMLYETIDYITTIGGINIDTGLWGAFFRASFPLCLIYNCKTHKIKSFYHFLGSNIYVLIPALILMTIYFVIGDRGFIITSGIVIVSVYSIMVKKIRSSYFIIGILAGVILMYTIRLTRSSDDSLASGNTSGFIKETEGVLHDFDLLAIFSDLTDIHRELYIGYEYVEQNGFVEPGQIILVPFYPLPAVPSFLSDALFGKTIQDIHPGMVLNRYMSYSGYGHFGIHCVIDLFMRWGIWGVVAFFYLWGYVVSCFTKSRKHNCLGIAFYVILISSAVYVPRAPILDIIRVFVFSAFLAWITSRVKMRSVQRKY